MLSHNSSIYNGHGLKLLGDEWYHKLFKRSFLHIFLLDILILLLSYYLFISHHLGVILSYLPRSFSALSSPLVVILVFLIFSICRALYYL